MGFRKSLKDFAIEAVIQGGHPQRINCYYKTLILEARKEFTEDNDFTLGSFLAEIHEEALKDVLKFYNPPPIRRNRNG